MRKVRSIFISDAHLGSKHSQSYMLLDFMEWAGFQRPENLYIVGDFFDGWRLKRNWHWTREYNLIIHEIFSLLKHGTRVHYIVGNHDEFMIPFIDHIKNLNLDNIVITDEYIHKSVNGDNILVIHGDKFDTAVRYAMKYSRFFCSLGDWSYDFLIWMNTWLNKIRRYLKLSYWSLSKAVKHQFKDAVNYIGGYETILVRYANEKGCQGVICGHIHTATIKKIQDIMYYNCGDWVESNTAIIEYDDGNFEIYHYRDINIKDY